MIFKGSSVLQKTLSLICFTTSLIACTATAKIVSKEADETAVYAAKTYQNEIVVSLRELIKHNTLAKEGVPATQNPAHIAFKNELAKQSKALGLDYKDEGYMVVISLGDSRLTDAEDRIGIITHGDVQPANPSKWAKSPFELDITTEPGKLIGRGTEDDKGPIVSALYAMKAIKDKNIALSKRLELYVYMAEESDWQPIQEYVKNNELPAINITLDAEYPVVTAEKGYGSIKLVFNKKPINTNAPYISEFSGGYFGSQIPEDAKAIIKNADTRTLSQLVEKAKTYPDVGFKFNLTDEELTIEALGKSAHSSKPQDGINAIPHLANFLKINKQWPNNGAGTLVNFLNDNIGIGLEGKKFGKIAYRDDFMGPMTVSPTVISENENEIELNINIRRPKGKSKQQLLNEISEQIQAWNDLNNTNIKELEHYIGEPFIQETAPQVDTLLTVFEHYTGIKNPQPIAIGGGTNSRLFPTAVAFGPTMPGDVYTGHSEHEFISMEQFVLNLKMYTAVFIELAK